MSLTKDDLKKISAYFDVQREMTDTKFEKFESKMMLEFSEISREMATKKQLEELKQMLIEDFAGVYEIIDELGVRVIALEKAI